ncbi:MAG: hypothetical protein CM15mP25_0070 [Gammaproteobacteria bacterium]|nr:MAG: hypothetical protein CM15mP25_0070 [Gammaproteobacteria bacterium]
MSGDGGPVDAQSESEALTELRNSDNQLYEALTLLRGINLLTPEAPAKVSEEKTGYSGARYPLYHRLYTDRHAGALLSLRDSDSNL